LPFGSRLRSGWRAVVLLVDEPWVASPPPSLHRKAAETAYFDLFLLSHYLGKIFSVAIMPKEIYNDFSIERNLMNQSSIPFMQYRLSTLFLIFFVVAASLAAFGAWGLGVAGILFIFAIAFHKAKSLWDGILNFILVFVGVFFIVIVPLTILLPWVKCDPEPGRYSACSNNLQQIGQALRNYECENKHFPPVFTMSPEGKPLQSWLVEILPYMDYEGIYDSLKKEEPWDSSYNSQVFCPIKEYRCPSANDNPKSLQCNYVAIIGPGTIWKANGTKTYQDLSVSGSSCYVVAVEVVDSGKHWAEPFALTADELLENMKTGKGVRISSKHHQVVHVLFNDGTVRRIPTNMPLSMWRKILNGKISNIDELEWLIDQPTPDTTDILQFQAKPEWPPYFSIIVWLISAAWLFYRAVKSRKNTPPGATVKPE
jgi:hypothetical protein